MPVLCYQYMVIEVIYVHVITYIAKPNYYTSITFNGIIVSI